MSYIFDLEMNWFCDDKLEAYDDHTDATKELKLTASYSNSDGDKVNECASLTGRLFDCTKVETDFWSFFEKDTIWTGTLV